jgi:hypothetical protein
MFLIFNIAFEVEVMLDKCLFLTNFIVSIIFKINEYE